MSSQRQAIIDAIDFIWRTMDDVKHGLQGQMQRTDLHRNTLAMLKEHEEKLFQLEGAMHAWTEKAKSGVFDNTSHLDWIINSKQWAEDVRQNWSISKEYLLSAAILLEGVAEDMRQVLH
jgi:hypothetical protein